LPDAQLYAGFGPRLRGVFGSIAACQSTGLSPAASSAQDAKRAAHVKHQKDPAMSIAEIERFAADLISNEALRTEAHKHDAEGHRETPLVHCVAFAESKGYAFRR
jgi:hypothetical protein